MSKPYTLSQQPGAGGRQDDRHADTLTNSLSDADRAELTRGLLAPTAQVSPKHLYDTLGSKLFECLCLLPEYYPTRTEAQIMRSNLADIARAVGQGRVLVDLGAGNCAKAEQLFDALSPAHYVAVDISVDFLNQAIERLQQAYAGITMTALGQDFSRGLQLGEDIPSSGRLFFYPGSSLGNFAPREASRFLANLRQSSGEPSSLLLGVDLIKETHVLNAAYDDALGLTSAFNLNLLRNLNRLLDADFVLNDWRHVAFFSEHESRVEMHLEAQRAVTVRWAGSSREFAKGERIHTESSYKYSRESLTNLLNTAGWVPTDFWTDDAGWFAVVHAVTSPTHLAEES